MLGTQIMARVRDALQVQLPLDSLFDNPTVAALCERIEPTRLAVRALCTLHRCSLWSATADLPLSFAQQRLWFLEQLAPGLPVFHIPARAAPAGQCSMRRC